MSQKYIGATGLQMKSIFTKEIDGPIQMLNLLKFKNEVNGKSGEEQYKEYMKAAMPFFESSGAKIIYFGRSILSVIGPDEVEWDKILLVEYPNKQNFMDMAMAEGYPTQLRDDALEDSRLVLCQ